MAIKKTLFLGLTALFSCALGVSVASFAGNNEIAEVQASSTDKVYLELNSSIWGQADAYYSIHYWGGSGTASTWPGIKLGKGSGNDILSGTWDPTATHVIITRWKNDAYNGDGGEEWNRWKWFDEKSFTSGDYNYFKNTAWDSCDSSYKYEVTKHVNGNVSTELVDKDTLYSPADPSEDGIFHGWYTDSSFTTPYAATNLNSDLELWAKLDSTDDVNSAVTYAQTFNNTFSQVCQADGSTSKTDLSTSWSNLESNFNNLSSSVQNILKDATDSYPKEDIVTFIEKYNFIYQKYGNELNLSNFLGKVYSSNTIRLITDGVDNSLMIIVLISSIAAISTIGALLVLKKKKAK